MSDKPQQKKPFFSCCSAQEEKKEALVQILDKRPIIQVQPPTIYQPLRVSAPVVITQQPNSRFRFTYQNPK